MSTPMTFKDSSASFSVLSVQAWDRRLVIQTRGMGGACGPQVWLTDDEVRRLRDALNAHLKD